jgi:RNA polymerase sigma-70 factor (ECF subfamily)
MSETITLLGPDPEKETALARAVIEGVPGSIDELLSLFRHKVLQYSYLTCRQRDDAEEVAQETMLLAYRHLHTLRDPSRVRAWMFRIARNACLLSRRKSKFEPSREDALATVKDTAANPEGQVLRDEVKQQLEEAMDLLTHGQRTVFLLREFEKMSTEETAEALEVSTAVVKTRLSRARRILRHKLYDYAGTAPAMGR